MPRAGARSWPFAVGLIHAATQSPAGEGSEGRLAVAIAAYHAGYYLVDVIEADARTGVTAGELARLWSLAVRIDADAVFVLGLEADGPALLEAMADKLRLVVRVVPWQDAATSSGESGQGDAEVTRSAENADLDYRSFCRQIASGRPACRP